MKPLVVGLGLHYHMKRKPEERIIIIQMVSLTASHVESNVTCDNFALVGSPDEATGINGYPHPRPDRRFRAHGRISPAAQVGIRKTN
jgi:hypothetical protein